jgi:hypothetical protein
LTDIYVDGDACPVREEIYRVAARLELDVFVVSNGSRPIRPPGTSNVKMVLVGDAADVHRKAHPHGAAAGERLCDDRPARGGGPASQPSWAITVSGRPGSPPISRTAARWKKAAAMANHASTRTTQLYYRRCYDVSLNQVERIVI